MPIKLIPAHAGVILPIARASNGGFTYPRTRGGDPSRKAEALRELLLSPHTRG